VGLFNIPLNFQTGTFISGKYREVPPVRQVKGTTTYAVSGWFRILRLFRNRGESKMGFSNNGDMKKSKV